MKQFMTGFSGGELAGVGIQAAGLEHVIGFEHDDAIAAVARANGFNVAAADIRQVNPYTLAPVDAAHFSPPCPNFSVAKTGGEETALDVSLAAAVAYIICVLRPEIVTLENVYAYRLSQSFAIITDALERCGYWWDFKNCNSADYGVPQTRHRLILRAVRGRMLPAWPKRLPKSQWAGWYAAIEDLLPTLPASEFAPWQLARLPEEMQAVMVDSHNTGQEFGKKHRVGGEPALSVTAETHPSHWPRAFILPGGGNTNLAESKPGRGAPCATAPMHSVTTVDGGGTMPRAFIVDCQDSGAAQGQTLRGQDEPTFTVSASMYPHRPARAFLASGGQGDYQDGVVHMTTAQPDDPAFTVTAGQEKRPIRAWLSSGRVVSMTPRALARFQSVPDWYKLPGKAGLACKIIGNGVPCKMIETIYRGLLA